LRFSQSSCVYVNKALLKNSNKEAWDRIILECTTIIIKLAD
jgi:hypothetical protein